MSISSPTKNAVQERCNEFPDDFLPKENSVYCKWCKKYLYCLRKDSLTAHLSSNLHQKRYLEQVKQTSSVAVSKTTLGKRKRPNSFEKDGGDPEEDTDEGLDKLFSNSDSDDQESFKGFDDQESDVLDQPAAVDEQPQKEVRQRKRPAHLSDSVFPKNMTNVVKTDSTPTSPVQKKMRKKSLQSPVSPSPIKKGRKNARQSYSQSPTYPEVKAPLKIKIRRKTDTKSKSFEVETSDEEQEKEEVQPEPEPVPEAARGSLKMKFFFKKPDKETPKSSTKAKKKKHKHKRVSVTDIKKRRSSENTETFNQSGNLDPEFEEDVLTDNQIPAAEEEIVASEEESVLEQKEEPVMEAGKSKELRVTSEEIPVAVEEVAIASGEETVVDGEDVVSWDAAEEVVEEEVGGDDVAPSPLPMSEPEPELTTEQSLAMKANHVRAMAKSVKASHFKKKGTKKADSKSEDKKRKASGYNLWSSKMRKQVATQFPGLQFGDVSKKLGDLWKKIPEKEKQMWKFRSVKMVNQLERLHSSTTKRKLGSKMIETGPKKKAKAAMQQKLARINTESQEFPPHKNPEQTMKRELAKIPPPSVEAIDAAAHFHLLGEALLAIGKTVRASRSVASTTGTLSLLLDSMVCSFVPLLTLTNQVPELNGALPDELMSDTFANISYYMPGL
uniref:transcription factor protein isoform X2 n=1 Tax=Ciona intestinalis TaxID=7719 RepID=UPI00005233C7|nr:transcription factor protein isoform X2 [Ciona intestinalis]|eukprot:XP_026691149.1 transcription factor protein isoform X2 [Ciona intestinalis]